MLLSWSAQTLSFLLLNSLTMMMQIEDQTLLRWLNCSTSLSSRSWSGPRETQRPTRKAKLWGLLWSVGSTFTLIYSEHTRTKISDRYPSYSPLDFIFSRSTWHDCNLNLSNSSSKSGKKEEKKQGRKRKFKGGEKKGGGKMRKKKCPTVGLEPATMATLQPTQLLPITSR